MSSQLFKTSYHDCNSVVVAALLHNQRPVASKYFWTQAGLYCIDHSGFLEVSPFYKRLEDELDNVGVKLYQGIIPIIEPIDFIISHLKERSTFGIRLNAYELPYSNSYQKEHNFHSIEIVSVDLDNQNFQVLDHFYRYEGTIGFKELEKAIFATDMTWKSAPEYFYFDLLPEKELHLDFNEEYLINSLKGNLEIMEGNKSGLNMKDDNLILGISAIDYLKQHIDRCLANVDEKNLDYLYESIKDVANSRYNFSNTLDNFEEEELSEQYQDAYQKWIVISNLILRAMVKGDYDRTRTRIENSFQRLKSCEMQLLDMLNDRVAISV